MKISIIIPTYNAQPYLEKLLKSLFTQTITFELIIIDSSSTDETLTMVKPYAQHIIVIPKNDFDHGGTRTKAAKIATGDIIIFLTQDALPYDNLSLEKLISSFSTTHIAAVYGRQLPYKTTNIFGKHLRIFNYPAASYIKSLKDKKLYGVKTAFLSDSFSAYKISVLKEVGWFKDGLIVGEDVHIGGKILLAGYSIGYVSDAKVYHSHSYSMSEEFKRYFDIGVFHQKEKWILQNFGKAEGEGGKYIKSEFSYLLKENAYHRIPEFFLRNSLKYLGYKLGKSYRLFPKWLIKNLSMHHAWWSNK